MRLARAGLVIAVVAVLAAACQLIGPGATPEPVVPAADPAVALQELCDVNSPAGFRMFAATLDQMDDDTDLAPIAALVRSVLSNLLSVQAQGSAEQARAGAVAALREMLNAIADPRLRNAMVRSQAAAALRAAEPPLCADVRGRPPTPGAPGGTTAERLCSADSPTGLSQMAARLEAVAADGAAADVTGLADAIDTLVADIYVLTGDPAALHVAQAAATALDGVRVVLDDPAARGVAARSAASTVRAAEAAVCP